MIFIIKNFILVFFIWVSQFIQLHSQCCDSLLSQLELLIYILIISGGVFYVLDLCSQIVDLCFLNIDLLNQSLLFIKKFLNFRFHLINKLSTTIILFYHIQFQLKSVHMFLKLSVLLINSHVLLFILSIFILFLLKIFQVLIKVFFHSLFIINHSL